VATVIRSAMGVVAVVIVLAGLLAEPAAIGSPRPPARVQVVAQEYRLSLSRASVRPGRVIVQLANFGEDAHDLVLQRAAPRARTFATPIVAPGRQAELVLRLAPARYRLWCSIGDHRERGMLATLTVK
jgi:hypothetical protein